MPQKVCRATLACVLTITRQWDDALGTFDPKPSDLLPASSVRRLVLRAADRDAEGRRDDAVS